MLKCRKFVEMIREYCEYNKQQAAAKDDVADMDNGIFDKNGIDINKDGKSGSMGEQQYHSISPSVSGGRRRPSYAAIAASLSPSNSSELMKRASIDNGNDESMDIDSENSLTVNSGGGHIWKKRGSVCSTGTTSSFLSTDRSMMDEEENTSQTDAPTLKAIMHYGQQLQDEYRNDHHEKTRSALVVSFIKQEYEERSLYINVFMNVIRRYFLYWLILIPIVVLLNISYTRPREMLLLLT